MKFSSDDMFWKAATGADVKSFERQKDQVCSVMFSLDGRLVASAPWTYTVGLWDTIAGNAP